MSAKGRIASITIFVIIAVVFRAVTVNLGFHVLLILLGVVILLGAIGYLILERLNTPNEGAS